jgi:Protein of unknown function (DUF2934)
MKNNNFSQNQNQKPVSTVPPKLGEPSNGNEKDFAPSADEVARRAYFNYVNEGSAPGRDVQHWLAAEADLIKERELTRTHSFHNHT